MKNIKWTERKFDFGYSSEYLPLFIERLKCTAPRIEEQTKNISEGHTTTMHGDKWSVKQHIGHLTDLEELHDGRVNDFKERKEILRSADMTNSKTEEADHIMFIISQIFKPFLTSELIKIL